MNKQYNFSPAVRRDCIVTNPDPVYVNKFTQDSLKVFSKEFNDCLSAGWGFVPIFIDSSGGSVLALLGMIDIIKKSPVPVATICISTAMSSGAILLSSGTRGWRYASPNSTILVHDISNEIIGKGEDITSEAKFTKKLKEKMFNIFDENCNKPYGSTEKKLKDINNSDWYLSPSEAKKYGIIDHLKSVVVNIDVTCKVSLV